MHKKNIGNEINIAVPYFIFYQAIAIIALTISNAINFFVVETLFLYILSLLAAGILIISGIELRKQKRLGIILFCVYLVIVLVLPIIRPIYVDSFKYIGDIIFFVIAIFLLTTRWKK